MKSMIKNRWKNIIVYIMLLAMLIVPLIINKYMVMVLDLGLLVAIVVLGMVVLVGFTGQLSLGQVAYYAIGSYAAGILCTRFPISPWIGILFAGFVGMLFGILVGIPAFNLNGPFLAIITIGFFEIVKILLINLQDLTGGPFGLMGIPSLKIGPIDFSQPLPFFYLVMFIMILVIVSVIRVRKSRIGRAMISVMNDEVASPMLGVNVRKVKLVSFGFSAFLAGLAGGLYAVFTGYIVPDAYTFSESALYLSMSVVSGFNAILASVVAVFLNMLPEALRALKEYYLLFFSIALLIFVMLSAWKQYKSNNEN